MRGTGRGLGKEREEEVLDLGFHGEDILTIGLDEGRVDGGTSVGKVVCENLRFIIGCGEVTNPIGAAGGERSQRGF